jgi:hypothetical protein
MTRERRITSRSKAYVLYAVLHAEPYYVECPYALAGFGPR